MPRSSRIEVPGGIHHVTARGNRRAPIFLDDEDRTQLLAIFGDAVPRFDAEILAYCLMGNHYHFVLHTRQAKLSALMGHVNGRYTKAFNRRHQVDGRLFEGRFKSIHVDEDAYLMAVCRYVERNPVGAGMTRSARDWRWSSFRANIGLVSAPAWLATERLHGFVLGHELRTAGDRQAARASYAAFVDSERDVRLWADHLREGRFLGDEAFVERVCRVA